MPTPDELTPGDLAQLAARGLTPADLTWQLARLRGHAVSTVLDRPCTSGDGILRLDPASQKTLLEQGEAAAAAGRVMKFVPASGAATRMFKELIAALAGTERPSEAPAAGEFFTRIDAFPFADEVRRRAGVPGVPSTEAEERALLRALLADMRLAGLPKALVPFHRSGRVRTALEEQLLEATRYGRDGHGGCRVQFTVPTEARAAFESAVARLRPLVEAERPGTVLDISLSEQHPSTDTVALDERGGLLRAADGTLVFRPSGHGALLPNLQETGGDLVVIKNIDNVLPDEASAEVVRWKRVLIGLLSEVQAEAFAHLAAVRDAACPDPALERARAFVEQRFARRPAGRAGREDLRRFLVSSLDRPLRVCGVVRNEGEPGGAPFWVRGTDGSTSVQIVEHAQVDPTDQAQRRLFESATHFNPVDLVCALRSLDGTPFDLAPFVDKDTAFVSKKSAGGREIAVLERPGLWNGGMAGWNTLTVDVPPATFAPVKTVFDLLRPQHQPQGPRAGGTDQA